MNNIYYTNISYDDGFGSQYQKIIQTYIYCKMNNLNFAYFPLKYIEHNYNNDEEYSNKLENVMNLKNDINNQFPFNNSKPKNYKTKTALLQK